MKAMAVRIANLERRNSPVSLIVVEPGETEASALSDYVAAHGPLCGPALFVCTGVPRKEVA